MESVRLNKLKQMFFILEQLQNTNSCWHYHTTVISVRITITSHYSKCSTLFTCDFTKHIYKMIIKRKYVGCSRSGQTSPISQAAIYFYSQYFLLLCNHCVINGCLYMIRTVIWHYSSSAHTSFVQSFFETSAALAVPLSCGLPAAICAALTIVIAASNACFVRVVILK